jgi:MFS family permease
MAELLRIADLRRYLAGQVLSLFGDSALLIVLAIWAKQLTHSSAAAGLVLFAVVAPSLLTPLAGVLVDRVRRRPLLVVVNVLSAIAVLPLLFVHDAGDVWILYVVGALDRKSVV